MLLAHAHKFHKIKNTKRYHQSLAYTAVTVYIGNPEIPEANCPLMITIEKISFSPVFFVLSCSTCLTYHLAVVTGTAPGILILSRLLSSFPFGFALLGFYFPVHCCVLWIVYSFYVSAFV